MLHAMKEKSNEWTIKKGKRIINAKEMFAPGHTKGMKTNAPAIEKPMLTAEIVVTSEGNGLISRRRPVASRRKPVGFFFPNRVAVPLMWRDLSIIESRGFHSEQTSDPGRWVLGTPARIFRACLP